MATGTVADWITDLEDYGLGDDIGPDNLLGIINSVIQDVNARMPWSFLEQSVSAALTSNNNAVTMPAHFNKVRSFAITTPATILLPSRRETLIRENIATLSTTGLPKFYYFIGPTLYVYPTPDSAYPYLLDYYQDEAQVTLATTLSTLLMPLKHQDVYLLGIIQRLYAVEDDTELYALFGGRFEQKLAAMVADLHRLGDAPYKLGLRKRNPQGGVI